MKIPASVNKVEREAFSNRNIRHLTFSGPAEIDVSAITSIPTLESVDFNGQKSWVCYGRSMPLMYLDPQPSLKSVLGWKNVDGLSRDFKALGTDKRQPREIDLWGSRYRIFYDTHTARLLAKEEIGEYEDVPGFVEFEDERFIVTSFEADIFRGNTVMRSIYLGDGLEDIPASAFQNCTGLSDVTMSTGLKTIGDFAFDGCGALQGVTIPEGVVKLGDAAFDKCVSLELVLLPSSLRRIGDHCFDYCPKLRSLTVPDGVTMGHDWFNPGRFD